MARKPVIIKKYENRRLYDTTNSRYINQDEVADLIRDGREVRVLDAATGEDLTRLVLTQIIVEDAKEQDSPFPLDILRQMVVASGQATKENTLKYMKAALDMYQNAFRALSPPVSPFEFLQPRSASPGASPGSQPAWNTADSQKVDAGNVRELQQRVAELETLITQMAVKKTVAKKRHAKPKPKSRRKS